MKTLLDARRTLESSTFLEQTRKHSLKLCAQLEDELRKIEFRTPITCIFAVGSAGRLEIGSCSDLDGVVVLLDQAQRSIAIEKAMHDIENVYLRLGFQTAKSSGIYRSPIQQSELLDTSQRGRIDEQPDIYGKRIQILLDARPIFRSEQFHRLQEQVLGWFLPTIQNETSYTFLINELQRYFHSYASWQSFKFDCTATDGWYLRQAKLRVTRVTTVGAMMLLIGLAMHTADRTILRDALSATPIERLVFVFSYYGEDAMRERLVTLYESALRLLLDEDTRSELISESPTCLEELDHSVPASYAKIHEVSDEMMALLAQFTLKRQRDWPIKFYRNWMF